MTRISLSNAERVCLALIVVFATLTGVAVIAAIKTLHLLLSMKERGWVTRDGKQREESACS